MLRQPVRFSCLGVLVAALVVVSGLAGCGQKGPLFLPQDKLDELERKRDERESEKAPAKTGRLESVPETVAAA